MEGEKGIVCVTGGADYFASWLIMKLIQYGYSVRTTKFNEDISHLKALPGASEKLEIFDADFSIPNSFDAAIEGCIGVFHIAHPTTFSSTESEEVVLKNAVDGTRNLLQACLNSKTVKRVVFNSSIVAVMFNKSIQDLHKIDEDVWTDVDYCKSLNPPGYAYYISKTLTEKVALEFSEERGLDVVTLLPTMVVGPFLVPYFPVVLQIALAMIRGDWQQMSLLKKPSLVHMDDLASAHIFLFECPEAKGRYICSSQSTTIHGLAKFLSIRYPEFQMPPVLLRDLEEEEEEPNRLSSQKLMNLGFKFKYGLEEMYDGAIKCCKEKGFL